MFLTAVRHETQTSHPIGPTTINKQQYNNHLEKRTLGRGGGGLKYILLANYSSYILLDSVKTQILLGSRVGFITVYTVSSEKQSNQNIRL